MREKRGLAYSVYSYLYPLDPAPLWLGGLGTANAAVGAGAPGGARSEIAGMAAGEINQAALDDAKTYLTGSFPLRLTSNDGDRRDAGRPCRSTSSASTISSGATATSRR